MSDFETTHWSTVLAAGGESTTRSRAPLATLYELYWYPLYAHLGRRGHSVEEGDDLTQGSSPASSTAWRFTHRARQRFRHVLREEIAQTVADPAEEESGIRHLIQSLRG
jgi:RNA polymerase sigma-70 factor (ECF subfamily)